MMRLCRLSGLTIEVMTSLTCCVPLLSVHFRLIGIEITPATTVAVVICGTVGALVGVSKSLRNIHSSSRTSFIYR